MKSLGALVIVLAVASLVAGQARTGASLEIYPQANPTGAPNCTGQALSKYLNAGDCYDGNTNPFFPGQCTWSLRFHGCDNNNLAHFTMWNMCACAGNAKRHQSVPGDKCLILDISAKRDTLSSYTFDCGQ